MATREERENRDDLLSVPWNDVVRFVRQLSHDLRNQLNAAELQSAYVEELAADAELKSEVKRLRGLTSELSKTLQKLSADLGHAKPTLIPYPAQDFVEDLRKKIEKDFPKESGSMQWDIQLGGATIDIDPQLVLQIFTELFANAIQHKRGTGVISVTARSDGDQFIFVLREPKTGFDLPTENWGREPLKSVGHGHYGLGLNRARVIVEAHNGGFSAEYDSSTATLVTTVTLPLSPQSK